MKTTHACDRRGFLARLGMASAFFTTPGAFAQQLVLTPAQTAGPFYPDKLPLDTDNDLLVINDRITPAVGEITYLSGRILDSSASPVRNAVIEIWQTDANGALHPQSKRQRGKPRRELPGIRKVPHGIEVANTYSALSSQSLIRDAPDTFTFRSSLPAARN